MQGYFLHSFGCRASAADGDSIAAELEQSGLAPAPAQDAQVLIVNTCAVTEQAERRARAMVRRLRRANPQARLLVTGCYAQREPTDLEALAGVDAVIGNSHKRQVTEAALAGSAGPGFVPLQALTGSLHTAYSTRWIAGEHRESEYGEAALPLTGAPARRTRPILRVQDGCGNRCSFCVIPETRGPSRSVPLEDALREARRFAAQGGQEMVLSGINLGRWGRDLSPQRTFADLVRGLLEETSLPRLRISSVEPMDWGRPLLGLFERYARGEHPRLAPHVHLPLQSGADAILRRMHRRYRPWHYAEKLGGLRALLPEAAIGADVMVGFPGETDALFEESYRFIEAQPFTYLHLFSFSSRPRTPAAVWQRECGVDGQRVRERMRALEQLATRRRLEFARSFLGRSLSAVTLQDGSALTANFLAVTLEGSAAANRLVSLRIASINNGVLHGHIDMSSPAAHSEF